MATYYKYQNPSEIGAAPTLDWSTVISNVNQNLQNQEQQRYENREADKKLTNDILTKANEVSLTSDPNLNALITNMGYDTKRNVFELQKKLESGQISRSDFTIANQNTSASIGQLNQFTKTYGADYDKYLKDVQEGKTSAYADFMQKWKGGFQNFKDKKLIHNPNDGRLYVAELDDKGKVKDGPLGMVPMSTLVEVKNFDDKKIDVLAETNRYASQMKPFVQLIRDGRIETREQLENFKEFDDLVKNITEAIAKNEKGYASILTDTDGTYKITGEGASSGKNIGLKNNGAGEMIPIIDADMTKRTRDVIKEYLIAQTGIKETGMERFAPQRAPAGDKGPKPEDIPTVGKVVPMYSQKTNKLAGPTFNLSNVRISQGPGIMQEIKSVALRNGQLVINGYNVVGKTTGSGVDFEKGTATETKRTKFTSAPLINGKRTKAEGLWESVNGAQMEDIITRVPIPGRPGETFQSLDQAREFLEREQQGMSSTRPVKGSKPTQTKTVIKRSELAAKAAAAGYSAVEYEKLLKQKGVKIE
jgi:hypothetical protein